MKKLLLIPCVFFAVAVWAQTSGFPYTPSENDLPNTSQDTISQGLHKMMNILREFRFQAYIQPEWQHADTAGAPSFAGGNFPSTANNRFLLRRGRFKFSFEHKNAKDLKIMEFAFQFDASEKGFTAIKDFYGKLIDPWTGWFGLQGGIFLRPFGFESPAPPAFHESPEFSRMNQTIMPNECELGEALVIESPAKFQSVYLRLDAAMVNGEGIGVGTQTGTYQNAKDFIGRIKVGKAWDLNGGAGHGGATLGFNASGSVYMGGVLQTTNNVYQIQSDTFKNITIGTADTANKFKKTYARQYYGAHLELKADYGIGTTTLRAEFIAGTQPGTLGSSQVPLGAANATPTSDLYIRKFNGMMLYFTQTIKAKFKTHVMYNDFTFKYDWYDPNTAVSGTQLNAGAKFTATDIKYSTIGFGYSFVPVNFFKLMIWYDLVKNESTGLSGWTSDFKKDNVLTIRTQFYVDTKWFAPKSKYKDNLMLKSY